MYGYNPDHILRLLWERINKLENKVQELATENETLQHQVKQLTPIHIDKIEYKIHELHVDTLSGTLNIGLTATGEELGVGEIIEKAVKQQDASQIVIEDEEDGQDPSSGH
ncbi:spore germination protein GerPC [Laceyella putida]|uniref:Spore germination protein GerPC n=1 Tax=Laceyella putida TaxID=110101 RepID=A0ABW2RNF4_9BACL